MKSSEVESIQIKFSLEWNLLQIYVIIARWKFNPVFENKLLENQNFF